MEKDRAQRYAESLETIIQNDYYYLKETIREFQDMCQMVTPEKRVPPGIVIKVQESYKEIRTRLTEIRAIQQLLQGKYRQYYRRDSLRDKEIMEFGFISKNCYSKFEYALMQKHAQEKGKAIERERAFRIDPTGVPYQWFHNKENQVIFIRNLRVLKELDYESPPKPVEEERRGTVQNLRSITLFVFSGEGKSIDDLQSKIRLREHDIIERYASDELHGLLTHLKEMDPLELERLFQRLLEMREFSKLKCLLFTIHPHKDLKGDVLGLMKKALQEMAEGEVKILSI